MYLISVDLQIFFHNLQYNYKHETSGWIKFVENIDIIFQLHNNMVRLKFTIYVVFEDGSMIHHTCVSINAR